MSDYALQTRCQEMTLVVKDTYQPLHLFLCVALNTVMLVASLMLEQRVDGSL